MAKLCRAHFIILKASGYIKSIGQMAGIGADICTKTSQLKSNQVFARYISRKPDFAQQVL